ncbi:MAG: hypothetical protein AB7F19_07010 [Candidatus Babeliales bacterium]
MWALDNYGSNQLHYVAQWAVLVDDDLPQYYLDNGVDSVLENKGAGAITASGTI